MDAMKQPHLVEAKPEETGDAAADAAKPEAGVSEDKAKAAAASSASSAPAPAPSPAAAAPAPAAAAKAEIDPALAAKAALMGVDISKLLKPAAGGAAAGGAGGASSAHRFWDTQPVPKLGEEVTHHGPIDPPKTVEEIRKEPYGLPPGYAWETLKVTDAAALKELYELLSENYVEDDGCTFRFNYSADFLLWALTPPHYYPDWLVGVRNTKTGALVACITGVPAQIQTYHNSMLMCEINFLCVHKKLRAKRLAPVLIKEVTRRVNLTGIFQATYTAGVTLPRPVSSCQYFHRNLNSKKLVEVGFCGLPKSLTMTRMIRLYQLPDAPATPGLRPMQAKDVPQACKLVNDYLMK